MTGALEEMNVIPETERSSQAQAEVGRTRSVPSDSSEDVPLQVRCKKRALSMHKAQPPSSTKKTGYKKSGLKRSREDAEQEESSPEFPSPVDNVSTSHGVGSTPARARQGLPDFKRMSISSSVEDKLAIYRHKVAKLIREGQVTYHSLLLTLDSQRLEISSDQGGGIQGVSSTDLMLLIWYSDLYKRQKALSAPINLCLESSGGLSMLCFRLIATHLLDAYYSEVT